MKFCSNNVLIKNIIVDVLDFASITLTIIISQELLTKGNLCCGVNSFVSEL